MFENIKGIIFDLDGTLIDSMWVWRKIDEDFIRDQGLSLAPEELMASIGHLSFHETAVYFKDTFQLPLSVEEIKAGWNAKARREYRDNVLLKHGAMEVLQRLKALNYKIALATSSSQELMKEALISKEILPYFDVLVTTDMAGKTKHEPDVYLLAAERMNLHPAEVAVFEDLPAAMNGARKAGMRVIGVHDAHSAPHREEMLTLCHHFIDHYDEVLHHLR